MPIMSVVIPSYNHADYVADAIKSVLSQTLTDIELIIIDDGSTDESINIINSFTDSRLKVFTQSNQGAHVAINRGLREASGKYIAILNSDDIYYPDRLSKALTILENDPEIGLYCSHIEVIDSQNKTLGIKHGYKDLSPWALEKPERSFRAGSDLRAALLTENYLSTTSNYVFSQKWYQLTGEFRPLRYTHDWDFALRITRVAELYIAQEPLLRYRVHAANTIRENLIAMVFEICWCLACHIPHHLEDNTYSSKHSQEFWVEHLLHSLYTFNCEQVLSVMLLQNLYKNHDYALQLLDPKNPTRLTFLDYIDQQMRNQIDNSGNNTAGNNSTESNLQSNTNNVKPTQRFLSKTKTLVKKITGRS